jgi:hypothetical protein
MEEMLGAVQRIWRGGGPEAGDRFCLCFIATPPASRSSDRRTAAARSRRRSRTSSAPPGRRRIPARGRRPEKSRPGAVNGSGLSVEGAPRAFSPRSSRFPVSTDSAPFLLRPRHRVSSGRAVLFEYGYMRPVANDPGDPFTFTTSHLSSTRSGQAAARGRNFALTSP